MPRRRHSPAGAELRDNAGGARPCAGDSTTRLNALRRVVGVAFLSGIALSPGLWFPAARTFPCAPLAVTLPRAAVTPVEYLISVLLAAALAALVIARRPAPYLTVALGALLPLALLDQTRLQPWVYQYLLLLTVLTLTGVWAGGAPASDRALRLSQLVVAALYFWSGVQKLNFTFAHETLPILLAPLQNILVATRVPPGALALGIALAEAFIGCGLLIRRTRGLCVWLAVAMHILIVGLLMARGYNSVVWAWNAALAVVVVVLFRRSEATPWRLFVSRAGSGAAARLAQAVAVACALLPVLSFWGWWDAYLSGALYSGNTAVAVVRVDRRVFEKLPETAKRQVFTTTSGELMLPLLEWGMADLNVPPYPEARVYRQVAREVCKLAENESQVELITKGRPAVFDGSYRVTRRSCSQLGMSAPGGP